MKRKKGNISINMVILAALALIVMVIVVVIFVSNSRKFGSTINGCHEKYGSDADCLDKESGECAQQGGRVDWTAQCDAQGLEECCLFGDSNSENEA